MTARCKSTHTHTPKGGSRGGMISPAQLGTANDKRRLSEYKI